MTGLLDLLQEFHREKLAMLLRHEASAGLLSQYDTNNTYQYVIAREDVQLSWVAQAIRELDGSPVDAVDAGRQRPGQAPTAAQAVLEADARDAQAFVDRWRSRVDAMSHARHRGMLLVILGEVLEQKRFFEQALAGRTDLLGRRANQPEPAQGEVLPTRWIE